MTGAIWWGVLASASLFIGQALARPLERRHQLTGLIMGFGAGMLLSAIAHELLPEANVAIGARVGLWLLLGAIVYYVGDRLLDRLGAGGRHTIRPGGTSPAMAFTVKKGWQAPKTKAETGSGGAMFLGALLDGIPEAFILGIGLAVGGTVSWAFLLAVFLSNVPQGVAGTTGLKSIGYSGGRIFSMWAGLTVVSGLAAGLGYLVADNVAHEGLDAKAFAAGALLMMLADSMIPEAYQHGGKTVGLLTVLGFLTAATLSVMQ